MTEFMLSDSKCQKICGLVEWNLFSQFFPSHKGIQQLSAANYLLCGNARARRRWQFITETRPEDEERRGNHGCLKGFCL